MNRSLPFAALAASVLLVSPIAAVRAQVPTLASQKAKTVQVTLSQWGTRPAPVGQVPPLENLEKLHVTIDNEHDRALFNEFDILPFMGKNRTPSQLSTDGKTQYELIGELNQFLKTPATPLKEGIHSRLGYGGTSLSLVMGWKAQGSKPELFQAAPDEALNGSKPFKVYVRTHEPTTYENPTTKTSVTYQAIEKLWVDLQTNLPVQLSYFSKQAGSADAPRELMRTEFTGWKIDAALPADTFAWTPPAGMAPYSPPKRPNMLQAGLTAPDFTAQKWGGGDVKLSDYKGRVVIVDFWATWCGPCQRSLPHVERLHQAVKAQGVEVLGVCVWDAKDAYEKWVPEHNDKYTFTFAFDPAGNSKGADSIASKLYGVSGIPATFVIGKDGKIIAAINGFGGEDDKRIEEALAKAGIALPTAVAQKK